MSSLFSVSLGNSPSPQSLPSLPILVNNNIVPVQCISHRRLCLGTYLNCGETGFFMPTDSVQRQSHEHFPASPLLIADSWSDPSGLIAHCWLAPTHFHFPDQCLYLVYITSQSSHITCCVSAEIAMLSLYSRNHGDHHFCGGFVKIAKLHFKQIPGYVHRRRRESPTCPGLVIGWARKRCSKA